MRAFTLAALVAAAGVSLATTHALANPLNKDKHVLLISVDGMHAFDLANYVSGHPNSMLASLTRHGATYTNALTSAPSDSFPGLLSMVTGGTAKSTGVFYDNSYDRTYFAPGSNCTGAPGSQVLYDETVDNDSTVLDAGGTLGMPLSQINQAALPMRLVGGVCQAVLPHAFLKVNTIFEVIHESGGRTAWSDKHPSYELVNGPSGTGVDDLFTPEIASNDTVTGKDHTKGYHSTQRYDAIKVAAIINEINGLDSTGKSAVGVPSIYGMNFQSVSVAQKLAIGSSADPSDAGLVGGYADAAGKPNNALADALDFVDHSLAQIVTALSANGQLNKTLIIITAKHGQSPVDINKRQAVDDSPYQVVPGVAQVTDDDVGLVWLKPAEQATQYAAARTTLVSLKASLGIHSLLTAPFLTTLYNSPFISARTPDFVAVTEAGVIYTSGTKLAEHGGFAANDRHVGLLIAGPGIAEKSIADPVTTTQIAPTILKLLGLTPARLTAVRQEHTAVLPAM